MTNQEIPVRVTISSEQIDKAILDSLIGSQLGQKISSEIEKHFGSGYGKLNINDIVNRIVSDQIQRATQELLMTQHIESIRSFVSEKMTDELLTSIFQKMWDSWERKW